MDRIVERLRQNYAEMKVVAVNPDRFIRKEGPSKDEVFEALRELAARGVVKERVMIRCADGHDVFAGDPESVKTKGKNARCRYCEFDSDPEDYYTDSSFWYQPTVTGFTCLICETAIGEGDLSSIQIANQNGEKVRKDNVHKACEATYWRKRTEAAETRSAKLNDELTRTRKELDDQLYGEGGLGQQVRRAEVLTKGLPDLVEAVEAAIAWFDQGDNDLLPGAFARRGQLKYALAALRGERKD